jgi:hypothetical protein
MECGGAKMGRISLSRGVESIVMRGNVMGTGREGRYILGTESIGRHA